MTGFTLSSSGVPWILKDPSAILDYEEDWSDWLTSAGDDTILTATWTVPVGLTKTDEEVTDTTTTVWLSGGIDGTQYTVKGHIVTAGGREDTRSFVVKCKNR